MDEDPRQEEPLPSDNEPKQNPARKEKRDTRSTEPNPKEKTPIPNTG